MVQCFQEFWISDIETVLRVCVQDEAVYIGVSLYVRSPALIGHNVTQCVDSYIQSNRSLKQTQHDPAHEKRRSRFSGMWLFKYPCAFPNWDYKHAFLHEAS